MNAILNDNTLQPSSPDNPNDFNIVIGSCVTDRDIEILFEREPINKLLDNITFPAIMKLCGAFKSTNDARKNGWNKEIPEGFSEWTIGKRQIRLTIFKLTKETIVEE